MLTALQGVCAGATVAWLDRIICRNLDGDPQRVRLDVYFVQINHMLYLVGAALRAANSSMSYFSPFARAVFILTPFLMLGKKQMSVTSFTEASKLNHFLSVTSSIALFALGHQAYALASLGMLAIDALDRKGELPSPLSQLHGVTAVALSALSYLSYGERIFLGNSILNTAAFSISSLALLYHNLPSDPLPPAENEQPPTPPSPVNPPYAHHSEPPPYGYPPVTYVYVPYPSPSFPDYSPPTAPVYTPPPPPVFSPAPFSTGPSLTFGSFGTAPPF